MKYKSSSGVLIPVFIFALPLIAALVVHAGTKTIELDPGIINGFGAEDVAVNPATHRIYTTNASSDSVSVVDGSTDEFIKNVAVGDGPSSIEINTATNRIYVANKDGNTVSVINGFTDTVMATINVGRSPDSLVVNDDTNRIYVGNSEDNTVSVINGSTNTVEAMVGVGTPGGTYGQIGMDINRTTKRVYVVNSSNVYAIDGDPVSPNFNTVLAIISPGFMGWGELNVELNEATNRVYILNGGFWVSGSYSDANIAIVDGTTNSLITNIALPGVYWASSLAVNENSNYLYVGVDDEESILIIDGSTNTLARKVPAAIGEFNDIEINKSTNLIYTVAGNDALIVIDGVPSSPTLHEVIYESQNFWGEALAIDEVTNRIYAGVPLGGILVLDGATNTTTKYISTGGTTGDLAVDEANNKLWVAHTSTSGIKIINTTTNNITDLALGFPVFGVLFNPNTNRVYAASLFPLSSLMIKVIDTTTLGVEAEIPSVNSIMAWAINSRTNRLYIIDGNQVNVIDGDPGSPDFNEVIATVTVGSVAEGMGINENTNFIYVGEETEGGTPSDIYVIDGTTNTLVTTITVGIAADHIAINQATNRIYTSNDGSHSISVIDGNPLSISFHTVIATIQLESEPEHLLINEATNRLYADVDGNSTLVVIDASTNTIEAVIPRSQSSEEVQFALDSTLNRIYATDEHLDILYIIDGDPASRLFNTIIETIHVGRAPGIPVVDKKNHRIYVSNEGDNTIFQYDDGSDPITLAVEAFVTRFYRLCLNREPDEAGLNGWVSALLDATLTGSDVANGFVFSEEFIKMDPTDEEYLQVLYEAFFNRKPDQGGWDGWLAALNSGTSRTDVLNGFIHAAEFAQLCDAYGILAAKQTRSPRELVEDFVSRFYQLCLDRDPDTAGLERWTHNLLNQIQTGADVANGFIYSPEFIAKSTANSQYLEILYKAFFGRDPDQGGWNLWIAELNRGKDRGEVLNGFIYSQEFTILCDNFGIKAYDSVPAPPLENFDGSWVGQAISTTANDDWGYPCGKATLNLTISD